MAFGSEIIAKLGLDTAAFSRGIAVAKEKVGAFGDDVGATLQKKLSGKDLFRGFLQGLGIGSAQQIAEKIVEPFRRAAEYAREIADLTGRVADSNIARNRSELSAGGQLLLLAKDRARLEQEFFDLSSRKRKSDEDTIKLAQLELKINESITREKTLRAEVEKSSAADKARLDREFDKMVEKGRAEAARDRENQDAWAAKKLQFETTHALRLAEQNEAREKALALAREQAEVARLQEERERATLAAVQARIEVLQQEALRAQLGSAGRDRTTFLLDGVNIPGQPRSRAEFDAASPEALQEFIRRQEALMARLDQGYGTGPSALVEVVTGGLIRALAKSTLQTEIGFARDRLNDFNRFSGKDRASALRDFEGDPLAFDRLFAASQRNLEAAERAANATEKLTRLFETGQARAGTVNLGP